MCYFRTCAMAEFAMLVSRSCRQPVLCYIYVCIVYINDLVAIIIEHTSGTEGATGKVTVEVRVRGPLEACERATFQFHPHGEVPSLFLFIFIDTFLGNDDVEQRGRSGAHCGHSHTSAILVLPLG